MSAIGAGALILVVYIAASSSLYFGLGLIAEQGLALTPAVLIVAGIFFVLTFMSYVEGSSLHIERGGASSYARYAFDELVSFVAGWAILLDYTIVLALVASAVPNYLSPLWSGFEKHTAEMIIPVLLIFGMAIANIRGVSAGQLRTRLPLGLIDLAVLIGVIVVGLITLWDTDALTQSIDLGTTPTWKGLALAMILATVAGTGIEAASGLAGEIRIGRGALRSVVAASAASTITIFAGLSIVALMVEPVKMLDGGGSATPLSGRYIEKPVIGVVSRFHPDWLASGLRYLVGAMAVITLVQAARIYMLGPMRMTYALATNRQIPSVIGRLHPRYGTPYVAAAAVALVSGALAILDNPELLTAIFAFGALLTFSIANLSIIRLRYREPEAPRAYTVPFSVKVGSGRLPLPSVVALAASIAAFAGVLAFRHTATLVGVLWMGAGLTLYVVYRRSQGRPLRQRITIPEADLRRRARESEKGGFGSMLVPVFGGVLDDDIIGTAGRLAMEEAEEEGGAVIEALHVIEIPMSQPIDAPVTADRLQRARQVLARAKEVGEEYAGVEVATATVRARSTGEAIVREASRRGVEVIVLAAERPSRIRGGPLLGGVEPRAAEFVGKVTEYVTRKAPCQVILTAPPETDVAALIASIKNNPHVSVEFAEKEVKRLERMAGLTGEHDPVSPGVAESGQATRPHEHEADQSQVVEGEDPDDFIDTIA
ncbi:MAG: universal stress protein [Actinobacteria bacterium]|nr:universal stress protein [Actinomycetota bacterium]